MKRVLSLTTTGLFVTGLALLPMSVRADQAAVTGKDGHAAPVVTTTTTVKAPMVPVKKADDKKVTTAPSAGAAVTKIPAKGS